MYLTRWVPVIVTATIGLAAAGNVLWTYRTVHATYVERRKVAVERVAAQFRASADAAGQRAAALATAFAALPAAEAAMKSQDRAALEAAAKPLFSSLKERFGVDTVLFHTLDAHVLLRMHAPTKFGDSVATRELVTTTLQRKILQSGMESAGTGVKIRGILPVGPQGGEVGLVEVALAFETMVEAVTEQTGFDVGVYIDSKLAANAPGRALGSFREVAVTNAGLMKSLIGDADIDLVQEVVTSDADVAGQAFGVVRWPLLDFANQNVGTVVAVRSFDDFAKSEREAALQLIVQAILMTVIGAGAVTLTFSGFVIRPLRSLRDGLEGDRTDISSLQERRDDIGAIARKVAERAA